LSLETLILGARLNHFILQRLGIRYEAARLQPATAD
jgi:hypothetical protein